MAEYITQVEIPSRGILYGNYDIPATFTIRAMTTADEKKILGSPSETAIDSVIKACVVEPKALNLDHLIIPDKHFLMMRVRIHTYGPDYHVKTTCPYCDETREVKISLEDFPVYYLEEDFKEPFDIVLPVSGKTLSLRLLRAGDVREVEKEAMKFVRKFPDAVQDEIEFLIRMARYVEKVDGEELGDDTKRKMISDLHARDSAYFWYQIRKIKIGYDTEMLTECVRCRKEYDMSFVMTSEFFRPRFDD